MVKPYVRLPVRDPDLNRVQDGITNAFQQLTSLRELDGQILQVTLEPGVTNKFGHLLGRKLIGWRAVRLRDETTLWDEQDSNPNPDLQLWLRSSAATAVLVDLFVF